MEHVRQFREACTAMKKDGTLTPERMSVAWLMFLPKDEAERTFQSMKKVIKTTAK